MFPKDWTLTRQVLEVLMEPITSLGLPLKSTAHWLAYTAGIDGLTVLEARSPWVLAGP